MSKWDLETFRPSTEPSRRSVDAGTRRPAEAEAVARRAYELFLQRGSEPGHEIDDWLQAEVELTQEADEAEPAEAALEAEGYSAPAVAPPVIVRRPARASVAPSVPTSPPPSGSDRQRPSGGGAGTRRA